MARTYTPSSSTLFLHLSGIHSTTEDAAQKLFSVIKQSAKFQACLLAYSWHYSDDVTVQGSRRCKGRTELYSDPRSTPRDRRRLIGQNLDLAFHPLFVISLSLRRCNNHQTSRCLHQYDSKKYQPCLCI